MDLTALTNVDQVSSAMMGRRTMPAIPVTAAVANEVLQRNLAKALADLDQIVTAAAADVRNFEVSEVEVGFAITTEGSVSLLIGGSVGAEAAIRVRLRPRGG